MIQPIITTTSRDGGKSQPARTQYIEQSTAAAAEAEAVEKQSNETASAVVN